MAALAPKKPRLTKCPKPKPQNQALAPKKPRLTKGRKPKPPNSALAPKKPLLTKRREPKPPNSAYAEFGNQNAEFHWRLWHLNNFALLNAPSQSLRIQLALNSGIRTPVPQALWHLKSHCLTKSREPKPPNSALAPKKPLLTKRREPKPPNSAYAEFGNQNAEFHWRKNIPRREPRQAPSTKPRQTIAKSAHLGEVAKSTGGRAVPDCRGGRTKKQGPPVFWAVPVFRTGKRYVPRLRNYRKGLVRELSMDQRQQ